MYDSSENMDLIIEDHFYFEPQADYKYAICRSCHGKKEEIQIACNVKQ